MPANAAPVRPKINPILRIVDGVADPRIGVTTLCIGTREGEPWLIRS